MVVVLNILGNSVAIQLVQRLIAAIIPGLVAPAAGDTAINVDSVGRRVVVIQATGDVDRRAGQRRPAGRRRGRTSFRWGYRVRNVHKSYYFPP